MTVTARTLYDTTFATVQVSADTTLAPHAKGDLVLGPDGKPFYDISTAIGLSQGADRALADKIDSLKIEISSQDFVIVDLLKRVEALEAKH